MGVGLALAGLGALAKAGTGIVQGIKANKIEKNTIRPFQEVQSEYTKNVEDAGQMARVGLPQEQYNRGIQNIGRNRAIGLTALSRSGNPNAGIQSLIRASNDAVGNLDVQDALARNSNQKFLMQQRGILAGEKKDAFDWNQKSKYLAQMAKAQALRGAAGQNLMGAFDDVQQIGMMAEQQENGGGGGQSMSRQQPTGGLYGAMQQYGTPNNGYNGRRV